MPALRRPRRLHHRDVQGHLLHHKDQTERHPGPPLPGHHHPRPVHEPNVHEERPPLQAVSRGVGGGRSR